MWQDANHRHAHEAPGPITVQQGSSKKNILKSQQWIKDSVVRVRDWQPGVEESERNTSDGDGSE